MLREATATAAERALRTIPRCSKAASGGYRQVAEPFDGF
jgi:hypothetical protein